MFSKTTFEINIRTIKNNLNLYTIQNEKNNELFLTAMVFETVQLFKIYK